MAKITREKFKTYGNVFDDFTLRNLFKLQSQGYFEELKSPIALGKEANVFSALRKDGKKVIVKIYRLENCDFNSMYTLIKSDDRYQNISKNKRNIIFSWTQREFRNIHKAREAGVNVPTPYHFVFNILIEEMIGDPAPKIKDANIIDKEKLKEDIIKEMKKLNKAGLVHGDLSQFNILYWNKKPFFIDFSQSVEKNNNNYQEYFERDIKNINSFFKKIGIKSSEESLKKEILK